MKLDKFIILTNILVENLPFKMFKVRPRCLFNDGFSVSIQAGYAIYSTPSEVSKEYSNFELGFPSEPDELITPFAETEDDLTHSVYKYVPKRIVEALIKKHGGFTKEFINQVTQTYNELGDKNNTF